jgi:hypothetical protein
MNGEGGIGRILTRAGRTLAERWNCHFETVGRRQREAVLKSILPVRGKDRCRKEVAVREPRKEMVRRVKAGHHRTMYRDARYSRQRLGKGKKVSL